MKLTSLSLRQVIQAVFPPENTHGISITMLHKRLQTYFPVQDIPDLLDRFGLITSTGAIDPLLIQQGLVEIRERFPGSNTLILRVTVTEHGLQVIKAILQAYLTPTNDGDRN